MRSCAATRCGLATVRRISCSRRRSAFAPGRRRSSRFTSFNAASRPSGATARHTSAVPPLPSSSTARQLPRFTPFGQSTAVKSNSVASAWVRIGGFRRGLPVDRRRAGGLGRRLSLDRRRISGSRRIARSRRIGVAATSSVDATAHLIVLLGGEAGLRCGEMIALEWRDVDLGKRQICVQRSDWNGQVTTPKGGRLRYVPLTIRLAAAFRDHRHLRSPNVLCQDDGQPLTRQMVQYRVLRASRRAKLSQDGVHILRHTFCSHLAMRGAPPRAIQELAGHRELGMTQRYMHLSPAALDSAIRLLDQPFSVQSFGDILETGRVSEEKING